MPDLNWNASFWGQQYNWSAAGDEWSITWGGSEAQWFGSLYPRLHRMVPARRILEIAPGYGRWTRFLLPLCSAYFGIDLAESCVNACRARFADVPYAAFLQNDGLSLGDVPDSSFDFIFSFDSLVHAEFEVLESYIPQVIRKLAPGGKAFLHHSNLASCDDGTFPKPHSRAASVSGKKIADLVHRSGGKMLVTELIDWGHPLLIDCLSTFGRADSVGQEPVLLENRRFMEEADIIRTNHSS